MLTDLYRQIKFMQQPVISGSKVGEAFYVENARLTEWMDFPVSISLGAERNDSLF